MGSAARMRHIHCVIRAVPFNESDTGDCNFVLEGSPIYGGQKMAETGDPGRICSRFDLVLIPFCSRFLPLMKIPPYMDRQYSK